MAQHDYRELAAVFVGGAIGAFARAGTDRIVPRDPHHWPWATFTVNIVGAFLVGYFTTRLLERLPLSSYRRPLLGTGLCGGLTTFSTMQVETLKMIEHHHYGLAAGYTVVSIAAGSDPAPGAGSVMQKQDRVAPAANGRSHRSFCSWEATASSRCMLPSSGAKICIATGPSRE